MTPYYETPLGKLYHGDCIEIMPELEPVDLVVTSPPYDNLRDYGGYVFDYKRTAKCLYLKVATGGVVVWVVGDATINGSETGTSFKHALYFKHVGFNLQDTMIYLNGKDMPSFRCDCGCNVFRQVRINFNEIIHHCNSCNQQWLGYK